MDYIFLIQARLNSTRFPRKILQSVKNDMSLLDMVYKRVLLSKRAHKNNTVFLIPKSNYELKKYLTLKNYNFYCGSENNVFLRFQNYLKSDTEKYDYFVRICSDNPFIEPQFIDTLTEIIDNDTRLYDYVSYYDFKSAKPAILTHYGLFVEFVNYHSFLSLNEKKLTKSEKEHVTPMFYSAGSHDNLFYPIPDDLLSYNFRFTVDTQEDLTVIRSILSKVQGNDFSYKDILKIVSNEDKLVDKMAQNIKSNAK